MSKVELWTLFQWVQMQYNNHSSISYSVRETPPTNYILTFIKPFSFIWYVIPLLKTGFFALTRDLFYGFDNENIEKNCRSHVQCMLSGIILARWQRPVASSEALDLLHRAIHAVTYQRIAMAIKTACFLGVFVDCCLFACCPGGRWGNTEQVAAQCRCPVASGVALNMTHRAMPSELLWRTAVTIETAGGWDAFVRHHRLLCLL